MRTDTFPGRTYEGTSFIVSEAEFTPKNVQTQKERVKLVYRIKIDIANPDGELKPGMPADAVIRGPERQVRCASGRNDMTSMPAIRQPTCAERSATWPPSTG